MPYILILKYLILIRKLYCENKLTELENDMKKFNKSKILINKNL